MSKYADGLIFMGKLEVVVFACIFLYSQEKFDHYLLNKGQYLK